MLRAVDIIIKKRGRGELSKEEIEFLINGINENTIPDYQLSAFLMAVFFNGMTFEETGFLTRAMIKSGEVYDLSPVNGIKVDKHSTGGVGDKISLTLAAAVAACGVPVPMVSGRGLGHTGGTLDKLQSIPGFDIGLTQKQFIEQLQKIGAAMIGQSSTFVPADKKLYSLRDVTGTVESIPLITASILSKKIASGADAFVMDVKCGSGAFMQSIDDAEALAESLVKTGASLGKKIIALITDMNQPLGNTVGNSLEVIESIDTLKGKGPEDVNEITIVLGANMLLLAGICGDMESARTKIQDALFNGAGLKKFAELIQAQRGNPEVVENYSLLDVSKETRDFAAAKDGYISEMNTRAIGTAAMVLGAGRLKVTDDVDPGVGLVFKKKFGEPVKKGETICAMYHRNGKNLESAMQILNDAIIITDKAAHVKSGLIKKIIQ